MRKLLGVLCAVVLGWPGAAIAAESDTDGSVSCREQRVSVALAPDRPADQTIATRLCGPSPLAGRVLHVLISGATYGSLAWDFPYQPERYSYVRAMNSSGIATLNVDRLGIARSSHPDSSEIDISAHIFIYHQLIEALRQGSFGTAFDKVVVVGHSYGGVITYGVANRYPADVDGVIIAGLQHEFDQAFLREFWGTLHPARDEGGRFAGLDEGYLTSRPGERHGYYHVPGTDPRVIQLDEETKETFTTTDARTFPPVMGESNGIVDPVLDVVGEFDRWFCAGEPCSSPTSTASREHNWFRATSCFEQYVVPDTGHDLTLHLNAPKWFAVAAEWTSRVVAAEGGCR